MPSLALKPFRVLQITTITRFCTLNQHTHLFSRMVPPKSFPKVGITPKGSFGGHNQPGSVSQTGVNPSSRLHNPVAESASSSLPSAYAKVSLQDEEFPSLGSESTSSAIYANSTDSPQRGSIKNPIGGSSHRTQMQGLSPASSKPRSAGTSSRQIHRGANKDDDWLAGADEEDALERRRVSKGKRAVTARKQPFDGGGERSTSGTEDRIYFLGRLLTNILRHKAVELNLKVRNDGYVVVSDLLKLAIKTRPGIPLSAYTVDDVLKAVERDNKQRFTLLTENDALLIRANQGHSIKTIESEKLLKPVLSSEEIPVCVHGTLMSNLNSILKTGLKKMGRNHVHFASGLPREDGVISGMRYTSDVLIYLDTKKALQDGMKLYMSDNGVILTEGFNGIVPPEYFAKIARWKNGKITPLSPNVKSEVT